MDKIRIGIYGYGNLGKGLKMRKPGVTGAVTVLDVPVSLLSTKTREELLKDTL